MMQHITNNSHICNTLSSTLTGDKSISLIKWSVYKKLHTTTTYENYTKINFLYYFWHIAIK